MKKLSIFLLAILLMASPALAGGSRDFAENTAYLQITASLDPAGGDGTYAFWVLGRDADADFKRICSSRNGAGTSGQIVGKRSGVNQEFLSATVAMGGTFRSALTTSPSMDDSVWRFVCVTFQDGTSAFVNLYIDDMTTAAASTSGNFGSYNASAASMFIGDEANNLSGNDWDGRICHAQFFDRVLTEQERWEIKYHPGSVRTNLTAYLPMQGVNSPEIDLSGNGNTGANTLTTESADGPPIFLTTGAAS